MELREIPIGKIKPAAYNPRRDLKPGDIEYEKLKKSIDMFDLVEPLVVNEKSGNLVSGHQRLKILLERGDKTVQCVVVNLSPRDEKALNIAMNRIEGEWDMPMLKDIIQNDLDLGDFDMMAIGFTEEELEGLMTQFHVGDDVLDDKGDKEPKTVTCPDCGRVIEL